MPDGTKPYLPHQGIAYLELGWSSLVQARLSLIIPLVREWDDIGGPIRFARFGACKHDAQLGLVFGRVPRMMTLIIAV